MKITKDTLASELTLPGYCRHSCCSIWFEIDNVWGHTDGTISAVSCAGRDPNNLNNYVSYGDFYSSLSEYETTPPPYHKFINLDRSKNFLDKFHPQELPTIKPVVL
jgi:hypothetical protein